MLNCYFGFLQNQYSLARAQQSFNSLVQIHEKSGKSQQVFDGFIYLLNSHLDEGTKLTLCYE